MRRSASMVAAAAFMTICAAPVMNAAASTITVQQGQTLWSIAAKYHTTVSKLQTLNPSIHGDTIQIGMKLVLPGSKHKPSAPSRTHIVVQSGDTLWSLAVQYHTTVAKLQALNPGLPSDGSIKIGQSLWVTGTGTQVPAHSQRVSQARAISASSSAKLSSRSDSFGPANASLDAQNLYWMAHIIHAEANGQSLQAKIAVGDVVWHRMLAAPGSTVKDIVFQQSNGQYQFSTVPEGYIYGTPDSDSETAAADVLMQHQDLVPGAYVFYGAHQQNDSWVLQQPVVATIGDFVFAK